MKRIITMIVLALGLLFCIGFANAERLDEPQGKEVKLSRAEWKKLNLFFCNFVEVGLRPFAEGQITDDTLIDFGISHNYYNNWKLFTKAGDLGYPERVKIEVRYVEASVEKYFGLKITKYKSPSEYYRYKKGYYMISPGDGEAFRFSQVTKLIDIGDCYLIAYTNEYIDSSGFTGDPNGSLETWKHDDEEGVPELWAKMRAVIKKVTEKNRSRYILVEYLRIDK